MKSTLVVVCRVWESTCFMVYTRICCSAAKQGVHDDHELLFILSMRLAGQGCILQMFGIVLLFILSACKRVLASL
jgi:hypothetical protein